MQLCVNNSLYSLAASWVIWKNYKSHIINVLLIKEFLLMSTLFFFLFFLENLRKEDGVTHYWNAAIYQTRQLAQVKPKTWQMGELYQCRQTMQQTVKQTKDQSLSDVGNVPLVKTSRYLRHNLLMKLVKVGRS